MSQVPKQNRVTGNKYNEQDFPFLAEMRRRFQKWTDIYDKDIEDALVDLTGDSFFEMRKLTSQVLSLVETMIADGYYLGYLRGEELTDEQRKDIRKVPEDLKTSLRNMLDTSWREMLNKQKVGVEKLALSLKPYLNEQNENAEIRPATDESES